MLYRAPDESTEDQYKMVKARYTPEELRTLIDALNGAPSYLSKRFMLTRLCGWSDEMIQENMRMRIEEENMKQQGDKTIWR